jgi:hypothetical protein
MFMASSALAGIGYFLVIVCSPYWKNYDKVVNGVIVVLLALAYTGCNFSQPFLQTMKDFSNFEGVMRIFTNPILVIAAWVHILGFDLFVAVWIKKDAVQRGMKHVWVIPALLVMIPFGPLGYLVYLVSRWIYSRRLSTV